MSLCLYQQQLYWRGTEGAVNPLFSRVDVVLLPPAILTPEPPPAQVRAGGVPVGTVCSADESCPPMHRGRGKQVFWSHNEPPLLSKSALYKFTDFYMLIKNDLNAFNARPALFSFCKCQASHYLFLCLSLFRIQNIDCFSAYVPDSG